MTPFDDVRALYVHVPFCPVICPYCDFHKMRRHEGLVAAYLDRLEDEAATLHASYPAALDTIYFGGGTPSQLTDQELGRLVRVLERTWGWPARVETTLEADPMTFDGPRAARFASMGFDRLSLGLQSTSDRTLQFLGRVHRRESGLAALHDAVRSGCAVSADLIVGVPRDGGDRDVEAELSEIAAAGALHVSVYSLTIEPHTPFAFAGVTVDVDQDADEFDLAERALLARGFRHYEVSNYALPGSESVHNRTYWGGDPYLALGPGATSFVPTAATPAAGLPTPATVIGVRRTSPTMRAWLAGVVPAIGDQASTSAGETIQVSASRWVEDVLMTGLRTDEGIDLAAVSDRSGIEVGARYGSAITDLEARGLLSHRGGRLVASGAGLRRLNLVLGELFDTAYSG